MGVEEERVHREILEQLASDNQPDNGETPSVREGSAEACSIFLRHQTLPDDEPFQTGFLLQNLNDRLVFGREEKSII